MGTVDDILQVKSPSFKRSRKGPERPKCQTFVSVHIYSIWALCLKQEPVKKVKGDRSYGVHKVGTVDDILQEKSQSFKRSRKSPERPKCKTFVSVHIHIIWALCLKQ